MDKIRISVITVTYNAQDTIARTMESVLMQTYEDIEYIIVDGASTDNTLDIVKEYAGKDKRINYISEKDEGLYDAMNKGVRMSHGDYINILNSGDRYADKDVVRDVAAAIDEKTDIIYGHIYYDHPDGTCTVRKYPGYCGKNFYYLLGDCINHQAIFANRGCFGEESFDQHYRITAAREWMVRQTKAGKRYKAIDRIICHYSLDPESVSLKNAGEAWDNVDEIIKKYYPCGYPIYWFINRIRKGKISSKILHKMYEIVYIRKT